MRFKTHAPCERLRPYIRHLAISETDKAARYPILPDTTQVMGFQYSGKLAYVRADGVRPLAQTYEKKLGKASVTGYCIRFKTLKDINIDILEAAIRYGFEAQYEKK